MPKAKINNKDFGKKLELRTKSFAINIMKLSSSLPASTECKVMRNQITKSGTSVGANYREANRSRSKADFSNKINICESEASETVYWLEIIAVYDWVPPDIVEELRIEGNELPAIFTSIGENIKSKTK